MSPMLVMVLPQLLLLHCSRSSLSNAVILPVYEHTPALKWHVDIGAVSSNIEYSRRTNEKMVILPVPKVWRRYRA